MHPAIIIGTVRSLIVDVAMGQIPRSTERISSWYADASLEYSCKFVYQGHRVNLEVTGTKNFLRKLHG